jgi:hypothetical protein
MKMASRVPISSVVQLVRVEYLVYGLCRTVYVSKEAVPHLIADIRNFAHMIHAGNNASKLHLQNEVSDLHTKKPVSDSGLIAVSAINTSVFEVVLQLFTS